jgi:hypothetical protein
MKETLLSSLDVHYLDGQFYEATKKYLEKQGCLWSEQREGDQLLSVHLDFPDGTVCTQAKYACEVRFPKGGMLWWSVKPDGGNGICVPYVYL